MKEKALKYCEECGTLFEATNNIQRYCRVICRENHNRRIGRERAAKYAKRGQRRAWLKTRFSVFRRDKFTCQYCGRGVPDGLKLHVDHVHPKSKGGLWVIDNLITSCFECNEGKKDVILSSRETEKLKNSKPEPI